MVTEKAGRDPAKAAAARLKQARKVARKDVELGRRVIAVTLQQARAKAKKRRLELSSSK